MDKKILDSKGNPIKSPEPSTQKMKRFGVGVKSLVVGVAALVALVAAVLGNIEKIEKFFEEEKVPAGVIKVSKIVVDCYRTDYSCVLDFRLLNAGDQTIIIDSVILEAYYIKSEWTSGLLDISGDYDLDISEVKNEGDKAEAIVSHSLKPNEAHRFVVNLKAKDLKAGEFRKWGFQITFDTSEGIVEAGFVPETPFTNDFVMLPWNLELSRMPPHLHPALQQQKEHSAKNR